MERRFGIVRTAAGLAIAFVLGSPSAARGGHGSKRFNGYFRAPHGEFSISIGSPSFPVGSYVPYGYRIWRRPRLGYGFGTPVFHCRPHRVWHAHWIPVRRYHRRWIVVKRPVYYGWGRYYDDPYDYGSSYHPSHVCWDACPIHHPVAVHVHSESCGHDWDDDD